MYCKHPEEACCNMTFYNGKIYCDNQNGFCHLYDEFPPYTNADRIRDMSDEEMAEFLVLSPEMEFEVCLYCEYMNPTPMDDRGECLHEFGMCYANARAEAFKKWLKQPVKEQLKV